MIRHFRLSVAFLFIIFVVIGISCNADIDDKVENENSKVNFTTSYYGQSSKYVLFYDKNYFGTEPLIHTGDTLILNVLGEKNGGSIIQECFAKYSQFHPSDWCRTLFPMSIIRDTFYYVLHTENNYLNIERLDDEHIFYSMIYQNQDVTENNSPLVALKNGKPSIMNAPKASGYCVNEEIGNQKYKRFNLLIDNSEMVAEDRGFCSMYHNDFGIIRKIIKYQGSDEAYGWELVP
ncbi:MAG: hypothetical protein KBA06_00245 [Saprospiraceae bacterium]|nr:hypothetical protein [Saprospiraceae bacterium]